MVIRTDHGAEFGLVIWEQRYVLASLLRWLSKKVNRQTEFEAWIFSLAYRENTDTSKKIEARSHRVRGEKKDRRKRSQSDISVPIYQLYICPDISQIYQSDIYYSARKKKKKKENLDGYFIEYHMKTGII